MAKIKETVPLEAFDRQDASVYLRVKLGPHYAWQKWLECWAKRNERETLHGLQLAPTCLEGRKPWYARADLDEFITNAIIIIPGLGPQPLRPTTLVIDADALRYPLPWRLRRARRCTRKTSRSTTTT